MADDKTAPHDNPREHPRDYDTPETPEGTPPVIRSGESGTEEDTDDEAREMVEKRQRDREDREGAGEEELDSMKPETLFPPD
ncbi:hypothetical protein [Erythrobacter sp.]|uniref:hypothetical protein n=1 Tax=Erythrobacter sp. TaxID=1042 RepID=UPI001425BE48|nr:hypothetical protein [Erythrobacter sp.]QIQ86939.1 MAG: hypothetical protein G9473_09755 [Erythrobacter sp.]